MTNIVLDAIAAEVAKLTREVDAPTEPFGYGKDLSCVSDLTETMEEVEGPLVVAQAIVRRLTTPRGGLPYDPNYGLDVRGFLNRATTTAELRSIAGQVRLEVTKDDRVESASVTVTAPSLNTLRIALDVEMADPEQTEFALTLAVTSSTVIMEALS